MYVPLSFSSTVYDEFIGDLMIADTCVLRGCDIVMFSETCDCGQTQSLIAS